MSAIENGKTSFKNQESRLYGSCVVCGERVASNQSYIVAKEGYCHKRCIKM